jgi:hypothetical protein
MVHRDRSGYSKASVTRRRYPREFWYFVALNALVAAAVAVAGMVVGR